MSDLILILILAVLGADFLIGGFGLLRLRREEKREQLTKKQTIK